MKKLISGLMVGIIASTCAMSTMAAPAFEHKKPHAPQQMHKKPVPPKPYKHQGPQQKPSHQHFQKDDRKSVNKHFSKQTHKAPPKPSMQHAKGPAPHKMPPKPVHHR